ncbi:MAG: hypothetical protein LUC16_00445 [Coprobacillus sp.]|nr:hypothetical protein [Coprobacillus sp.]
MARAKRLIRCYRCGRTLQTSDPTQPGYIKEDLLSEISVSDRILYCQECYDEMIKLNNSKLDLTVGDEICSILDRAVNTDAEIIYVVNLFTFNGTLPNDVAEKIKRLNVLVVGTKVDLFNSKKDITPRLIEWLRERFEEYDIHPLQIRVTGKGDKYSGEDFVRFADEYREGRDVYIIGDIGSGKTSLINKGLTGFQNNSNWSITRTSFPGTSERILAIPLSNSSFIYEVPGFPLSHNVVTLVEKEVARAITPKKEVKVVRKAMKSGECLMIGNIASYHLYSGEDTVVNVYTAENVECKVIPSYRYEPTFNRNKDKKEIRPVSEKLSHFMDFDLFEYDMENDGLMHDIAIEGLGWISFVGRGQVFYVYLPHLSALRESRSKIE